MDNINCCSEVKLLHFSERALMGFVVCLLKSTLVHALVKLSIVRVCSFVHTSHFPEVSMQGFN